MRLAEARRSASIISSNSINESLTEPPAGVRQIDWSTKTSAPRTFSRISTRHSSFLKRSTSALPTRVCIFFATSSASSRLEVPLNSNGVHEERGALQKHHGDGFVRVYSGASSQPRHPELCRGTATQRHGLGRSLDKLGMTASTSSG